jgi:hypothetical protein
MTIVSKASKGGVDMVALIAVCLLAFVGSAVVAADANAQLGANYGIAPAEGSALAGHDTAFWVGACDLDAASTSNGGVGTPPASFPHCIDPGEAAGFCLPVDCPPNGDYDDTWAAGQQPAWRLDPFAAAGSRPDLTTMFWLKRSENASFWGTQQSDGDTKTVLVKLPPGLVGNPNAVPQCKSEDLNSEPNTCPPESQVGVSTVVMGSADPSKPIFTTLHPVYNVEARDGNTAELLFSPQQTPSVGASIPVVAKARTDDDYGISAVATNLPGGIPVLGQTLTLWGVPWAASHDRYRPIPGYQGHDAGNNGGIPPNGLPGGSEDFGPPVGVVSQEPQPYDPEWGPIRPFMTNATECAPTAQLSTIDLDNWQNPGSLVSTTEPAEVPLGDCDDVPFDPSLAMQPTSTVADSASGLSADLDIPQNDDPPVPVQYDPDDDSGAPAHWKSQAGLATAHLDRSVVTLPNGVSANPSSAAGLLGCSDAQVGLVQDASPARFNNEDPFDQKGVECPNGSKIGTAQAYTPLLPGDPGEPNLKGEVVLGSPKSTDPESGRMFRLFLVVRNRQRGLLAKVAGSATADKDTGQLTATFDKSPRAPFETLHLDLKGGPRGWLAMPQQCGTPGWSALFTPWTAAHGGGGDPVPAGSSFTVGSRCTLGFAPTLTAGMSNRQAGAGGTFSFRFARQDGEQWFASATARLPGGLAAKLEGVARCTDAQAAAAACPAASRIGTVDAAGGSGDPFVLEKKGSAYLTGPYKGAPLGLATIVPVEAGPFKGAFALKTIVVRQALFIDPDDASATAVSDPFPTIWHGIPLRVREATLRIDRPDFMVNPTDCSPKAIGATLVSVGGVRSARSRPFQAAGCGRLAFKPKLAMGLVGKRQLRTGKNPGLKATLTQKGGQANIAATTLRMPLSLALDPDNAQSDALCEFEEGRKDDPRCPRASIVGRVRAISPLLDKPLRGNVYFVKNVRIDPDTGNRIRTLPSLLFALRGEVSINVRANSDSKGGKLITTFPAVPDAPVSRFDVRLKGGKKGILNVTGPKKNLCRGSARRRQVAEVDMDGQNGRRWDRDVKIKVPCPKRGK